MFQLIKYLIKATNKQSQSNINQDLKLISLVRSLNVFVFTGFCISCV